MYFSGKSTAVVQGANVRATETACHLQGRQAPLPRVPRQHLGNSTAWKSFTVEPGNFRCQMKNEMLSDKSWTSSTCLALYRLPASDPVWTEARRWTSSSDDTSARTSFRREDWSILIILEFTTMRLPSRTVTDSRLLTSSTRTRVQLI